MQPPGMEYHVEEEAPDLVTLIGTVDEHGVRGYGSPWRRLTRDHWVVNKETQLGEK